MSSKKPISEEVRQQIAAMGYKLKQEEPVLRLSNLQRAIASEDEFERKEDEFERNEEEQKREEIDSPSIQPVLQENISEIIANQEDVGSCTLHSSCKILTRIVVIIMKTVLPDADYIFSKTAGSNPERSLSCNITMYNTRILEHRVSKDSPVLASIKEAIRCFRGIDNEMHFIRWFIFYIFYRMILYKYVEYSYNYEEALSWLIDLIQNYPSERKWNVEYILKTIEPFFGRETLGYLDRSMDKINTIFDTVSEYLKTNPATVYSLKIPSIRYLVEQGTYAVDVYDIISIFRERIIPLNYYLGINIFSDDGPGHAMTIVDIKQDNSISIKNSWGSSPATQLLLGDFIDGILNIDIDSFIKKTSTFVAIYFMFIIPEAVNIEPEMNSIVVYTLDYNPEEITMLKNRYVWPRPYLRLLNTNRGKYAKTMQQVLNIRTSDIDRLDAYPSTKLEGGRKRKTKRYKQNKQSTSKRRSKYKSKKRR